MFNIKIIVLNTITNKEEKPTQYNTFFDENGKLQGIQDNLKIIYRIEAEEEE